MTDTSKILIDIDSLFDLRQATLYSLVKDKEQLTDYLISEAYNFRSYDNFLDLTEEDFVTAHNKRNFSIFPYATITYLLNVIKIKLNNLEKRNNYYNEKKPPELLVNVYPFILTKEQSELFRDLIFVKIEKKSLVKIVSLSPKEITPSFIVNNNVTACFMYDFSAWMDAHAKVLESAKLTDCLFYFPSIGKKNPTPEEERHIKSLGFKDLFSYTEFLLSSVMPVSFLPTVFYSNIITSISYLDKFNDTLMKRDMSKDVPDVDISKFNIPEV